MKALLRINYTDLLLQDDNGVQKLMQILGKAKLVEERIWEKQEIKLQARPLEISFRVVPDTVRIVGPDKPKMPKTKKKKLPELMPGADPG